MKLAWKKRKPIKTRMRCVVSFLVFCQENLFLVPFPAHRQQVPSMIKSLYRAFTKSNLWMVLVDRKTDGFQDEISLDI